MACAAAHHSTGYANMMRLHKVAATWHQPCRQSSKLTPSCAAAHLLIILIIVFVVVLVIVVVELVLVIHVYRRAGVPGDSARDDLILQVLPAAMPACNARVFQYISDEGVAVISTARRPSVSRSVSTHAVQTQPR